MTQPLHALFFALLSLSAIGSFAADNIPAPEGLKFELVFAQKQYHIGERIEVILRYTYKGEEKLCVVSMAGVHPGRPSALGFTAKAPPGTKVSDPSEHYNASFGGGYPYIEFSADGVCEDKADLNEWITFETPGVYTIEGWSRGVGDAQERTGISNPRYKLNAKPVQVEILPALDDAARREIIRSAETALQSPDKSVRGTAARQLWYLRDERAIPLLLKCLGDNRDNMSLKNPGLMGLIQFTRSKAVKEAILKTCDSDPEFLHPYIFDDLALLLARADSEKNDEIRPAQKRWEETLRKRRLDQLRRRDPVLAINDTVQMMGQGHADRKDKELWNEIFDNFKLLKYESLDILAHILGGDFNLPEFVPRIRLLAQEITVDDRVRSGAIIALHRMNDISMREAVYEDLVSRIPKFTREAHLTLGDYKEAERTAALLKLAEAGGEDQLGERIRNFAPKATAQQLLLAFEQLSNLPDIRSKILASTGILTALALVSPTSGLELIEKVLDGDPQKYFYVHDEAMKILARLNSPAAVKLTKSLIGRMSENTVAGLFSAIGEAATSDQFRNPAQLPERELPRSKFVPRAVFPDILDWIIGHPTADARSHAYYALHYISGIPKQYQAITDYDAKTFIPLWSKWWEEHKAEINAESAKGK